MIIFYEKWNNHAQKQAIDITSMPYNADYDRYQVIEYPFLSGGKFLTMLYKPSIQREENILHFLSIFALKIWILIGISYLIICLLNCIRNNSNISIKIALEYFGLILTKGLHVRKHHNRILLATWASGSFFLNFLFTNDILANLMSIRVSSIDGLGDVYHKKYRILMIPGMYERIYVCKVSSISIWFKFN